MTDRLAFAGWRLRWSRWLVLAVLSLCLPLQGALAVTMQVCGPAPVSTAMAHDHAAMMAAAMADAGGDDHMDHMDHMDHVSHADATSASSSADPHVDHQTDHKCSICAHCCVGAAIPVTPLSLEADARRDALPVLGAVSGPNQTPTSLDRPPKAFLA